MTQVPICDYEGSDYQNTFWDRGREYEDRAEAIALKRLLPPGGRLLLEVGAGAGRHTPRYAGYEQVVLVDYSFSQLEQALQRLGRSDRYTFVAADVYRLPFRAAAFDAATMIRTLHHMADPLKALRQVGGTLQPDAVFILEFANKRNMKAVLRFLAGRQSWNPFSLEPAEFAALNFDFHPRAVQGWLSEAGFEVERVLTVSHFRLGLLKRVFGARVLAALDGLLQPTGAWCQFTPSVFVRSRARHASAKAASQVSTGPRVADHTDIFRCPRCNCAPLQHVAEGRHCTSCGSDWPVRNGIHDFRIRD